MKFATPCDDRTLKLLHMALTDHPYEEVLALFGEQMHIPWGWRHFYKHFLS
jgi:hypothetical protein